MIDLFLKGFAIYIGGFILAGISTNVINSNSDVVFSYYYCIIFSILYLSAVVGISACLIIRELRKNKN